MLQVVDFRTTAGDTGEPEGDAIAPYVNGESADQTVFRRPAENNRARTDKLRDLLRQHVLIRDYNEGGTVVGDCGTVTPVTGGGGELTFTTAANLYLVPFGTPGGAAGSPWVASTKAQLSIGSGVNELVFTSVQKQYEGATFPEADANAISVEVLDGGGGASLVVTVEGAAGEASHVKIVLDAAAHTLNDVIGAVAAIPAAASLMVATLGTTAVGTNLCPLHGPSEWAGDFEQRFLRGGAPGLAHEITPGGLVSFFSTQANELAKGDTLAISYDKIVNTTTTGGRAQSTPENTNVNVDAALFNTRRLPELIPNCIPICKRLDADHLVFVNGAVIKLGEPATLWFDSYGLNGAENGLLATPLSWDRIGDGPDHNPPTTIRQALDNADGRVDSALDQIEEAYTSTIRGSFGNLDARLEQEERRSRYRSVTVSDGTTSTFGEFNGIDAIRDAITNYSFQNGLVIYVMPGTYTMSISVAISNPVHIVGVGEDVIINYAGTVQPMLTYSSKAHGSVLENVVINNPGSNKALYFNDVDHCRVVGCSITGHIEVSANAQQTVLDQCRIYAPNNAPGVAVTDLIKIGGSHTMIRGTSIYVNDAFVTVSGIRVEPGIGNTTIEDCIIESRVNGVDITSSAAHTVINRCYFDATTSSAKGVSCVSQVTISDCLFNGGANGAVAISLGALSEKCLITNTQVQGYLWFGGATALVSLLGSSHKVTNMTITSLGTASHLGNQILSSMIAVVGNDTTIHGLEIDCRDMEIGDFALGENPLYFAGWGLVISGLTMHNFSWLYGAGAGAGHNPYAPIICLQGDDGSDFKNGVVSLVDSTIREFGYLGSPTTDYMDGVLIGANDYTSNTGAAGANGHFVMRNVTVDGISKVGGNILSTCKAVGNIPPGSLIEACHFYEGTWRWVIYGDFCDRVQILNNVIRYSGEATYQVATDIQLGGTGDVDQCKINGNTIYHRSGESRAITLSSSTTSQQNQCLDNHCYWTAGASPTESILIVGQNRGIVRNNIVNVGITYTSVTNMIPSTITGAENQL